MKITKIKYFPLLLSISKTRILWPRWWSSDTLRCSIAPSASRHAVTVVGRSPPRRCSDSDSRPITVQCAVIIAIAPRIAHRAWLRPFVSLGWSWQADGRPLWRGKGWWPARGPNAPSPPTVSPMTPVGEQLCDSSSFIMSHPRSLAPNSISARFARSQAGRWAAGTSWPNGCNSRSPLLWTRSCSG